MKKKISLIIPFYNEEKELKKIFEDISKFEKSNKLIDEYIFIDDCSYDNSNLICRNFIKSNRSNLKKKLFLFKNKKNFGWAKTLKRGYNLSRNDYCLYIPGDGEAKICQFLKKNIIKKITFIFKYLILIKCNIIKIMIKIMAKKRPLSKCIYLRVFNKLNC